MTTTRQRTQYLVLAALFAALTAVGAFIKIPVGPVPVSLQILFVALAGVFLGPWYGLISQLLYLGLGLAGLPIFTSGGGPGYIFNPSFGYMIGFLILPVIVGYVTRRFDAKFLPVLIGTMGGILVVYAIGVPYMYMIMRNVMNADITFSHAVMIGFILFIPGDIAKSLITAYCAKRMVPILRRSGLIES